MAGTIYGTVKNTSGTLLTNATVTSPSLTVTNSNGAYTAVFFTGGTYALTASAPGYVPKTDNVTVSTGQTLQHNFVLQTA
jgi:hypothetical protein